MIEATISCEPFPTTARMLRMRWTRQRCQLAPRNTVPMAFFSPVLASEMTNFTPSSPRVFNNRKKPAQKPHSHRSRRRDKEHFPAPIGGHPNREQRLIDAAVPLQQGWGDQLRAQLRNSQPRVPAVVVNVRGLLPLRWVVRSTESSKRKHR